MKKYILFSIVVTALASTSFLVIVGSTFAMEKGTVKFFNESKGNITISDLGITNVGFLPTSKWYFFKEWKRGLEQFFTFNSIAKAELELSITNKKIAEALIIQENKPDDTKALATALLNYTKSEQRLQARLVDFKETSDNPQVAKLILKFDEQTFKHIELLNQFLTRYIGDPDFDLIANVTNDAQGKIQNAVVAAVGKEKNIKEKAVEQIKLAGVAIRELKSELVRLGVNNAGASNEKTGPVRIDSTPARISTNMTIERQTPKTDFGDRMKAGLDVAQGILAKAQEHLATATTAFADGKFGEAFGEARSAEALARNGLRIIDNTKEGLKDTLKTQVKIVPSTTPNKDEKDGMPIVPGKDTSGKTSPEREKRAFPETK